MKLLILGNCQAQVLERLFALCGTDVEVARTQPVYTLNDTDLDTFEGLCRNADLVFAQRVSDNYHLEWVRPTALRESLGPKLVTWPNLYFDGYFPGIQYLYLDGWGKLSSPLEDYHYAAIMGEWKACTSLANMASMLLETRPPSDLGPFARSLAQLRNRERDTDVAISDFISAEVASRRCFYTPNHLYNLVLIELARRLAKFSSIPFDGRCTAALPPALSRIYLPTSPWIVVSRSLPFDRSTNYRGVEVRSVEAGTVVLGPPLLMNAVQLVSAFYRIYSLAIEQDK